MDFGSDVRAAHIMRMPSPSPLVSRPSSLVSRLSSLVSRLSSLVSRVPCSLSVCSNAYGVQESVFAVYKAYVNNYSLSQRLLSTARTAAPEFAEWLKKVLPNTRAVLLLGDQLSRAAREQQRMRVQDSNELVGGPDPADTALHVAMPGTTLRGP